MAGATKTIVINAPVEKVFDALTRYEEYPEYLQEVKAVSTSNRQGNVVEVHYEVEVMKLIKYSLKMTEERPKKLSWTFIKGEFMKDNKGSWVLEPEGEGKTRVTYTVEMSLGALVPKSVVNALAETSLPKMLEATRKRVEST
ncbi:MAG: SRPBCC family protein [Myxococcota bacterium]|nr:SRPBCC family protein [Myxococcota bacterium]